MCAKRMIINMSSADKQALELAKKFNLAYLVERDFDKVVTFLDDNIIWIGTGLNELCLNIDEAKSFLEKEREQWNGKFIIDESTNNIVALNSSCFCVFGNISIIENSNNDFLIKMNIRYSYIFILRNEELKLTHIHYSVPNSEQINGEIVPISNTDMQNKAITKAVEEKTIELEKITRDFIESETRYKFAMEASNEITFEFDYVNDRIIYDEKKFEDFFLYVPNLKTVKDGKDAVVNFLHPDDLKAFYSVFDKSRIINDILFGQKSKSFECRIMGKYYDYIWVQMTIIPIVDKMNNLDKIIGHVKNIDDQKRRELLVQEMSQKDQLTGIYNKSFAESLIQQFIENGDSYGSIMLIFDLDNFKYINDNYGHLFGDAILSSFAQNLIDVFDDKDIIGRIGGDEFVAFIKNPECLEVAIEKVEKIKSAFSKSNENIDSTTPMSLSIGIAEYTKETKSFLQLFSNADVALYAAKGNGKNRYEIYDFEMRKSKIISNVVSHAVIDRSAISFKDNIAKFVFQILYETTDVYSAIQLILELVGKHYNVSHAYIVENSDDNTQFTNTFEWCNDGVESEKDRLKNVPYSRSSNYGSYFDMNGVFYCDDISKLPTKTYNTLINKNICSFLQCEIINNTQFKGYVGFDECDKTRLWVKDEIEVLSFVAKILSVFLVKMRTQEKLNDSLAITEKVLNNQNSWSYVIDKDTYELLFVNNRTVELIPGAKIGGACYKTFFNGREEQCDVCPVEMLGITKSQCYTMDIYNDYFDIWTNTTVSNITWIDGREVCLVCCSDISKYYSRFKKE